jgi:4-amino-4-deoxy-L-arabinose transferase-like glycosyltransferase
MKSFRDLPAAFQRWIGRYRFWLLLGLVLAYLVLNLLTLDRVPLIDVDEAVEADAAWVLWREGHSTPTMMGGHAHLGRLHLWPRGFLFALSGVGPYQDRLPSLVFGVVGLWFTYLLGKELYNRTKGLMAASLLAISTLYFNFSHYGRGDMLLTLFYVTSAYCLWRATHGGARWLYLLCGLLSALSIDAHLNGVALPAVMGILLIAHFRRHTLHERGVWVWGAGVAVGLLYYLFVHVILDGANFLGQREFLHSRRPPLLAMDWYAILTSWLDRYVWYYWKSHRVRIFELSVLLGGLIGPVINRKESDRFLLLILGTQFVLSTMLYTGQAEQYLVYCYPFLMLAVARTGLWLWHHGDLRLKRWTLRLCTIMSALVLIGGLFAFYTGALFVKFRRELGSDYDAYQRKLRAVIPDGALTFGNHNNWFGFHDQPYLFYGFFGRSLDQLNDRLDPKRVQDCRLATQASSIEYLIADEMVLYQLTGQREDSSQVKVVDALLKERCLAIFTLEDSYYGGGWPGQGPPYQTTVYRCRVSSTAP